MNRPDFHPLQAEEIARAFQEAGVDYLFLGKSGAILLGYPGTTQDVDVFPARTPENGRRITSALKNLGFEIGAELEKEIVTGKDFVQIKTGPFDVDLVFAPDGIDDFAEAKARGITVGIFRVANLKDIIASKRASGRQKDMIDLPLLESFRVEYKSGIDSRSNRPQTLRPGGGPQIEFAMTNNQIANANAELRNKSPFDIVTWAIAHANGRAVVSTNFRPYEAVILHLVTRVQPDIPVLWVDHGYNRLATYRHGEQLKKQLKLNIKAYVPRITAAHYDAIHGGAPEPTAENEERIKVFSTVMKLEPFQRGMKELAPKVWITALRKVQNPNRAGLDIVSHDENFGVLKVSPLFYWSDAEMDAYLKQHHLPNEWDYFDPAKADDKRECGLHAAWGGQAVAKA